MTISRLMLTTALIGTLALPAMAQTQGAMPGASHHATALRHRVAKPARPVHPIATPSGVAGTTAAVPAPAAAIK